MQQADPFPGAYSPPELDWSTGEVKDEDRIDALSFFGPRFPGVGPHPGPWTSELSYQSELEAQRKALFDSYIQPRKRPYVWATDLRGMAGQHSLQKERDKDRQRLALMKIAEAGLIKGAIGVAVGEITDEELLLPSLERLRESPYFLTGSLELRIHLQKT